MTVASLAILALIGQSPAPDPSSLVGQLGSRRYAERESAAARLVQLGRPALPALRAARSARDLEIRDRAGALVTRIEGSLLTQPTWIALDFQDRPLAEVLRAVGEQSGVMLTSANPRDPDLMRRVTLREPSPVPFWKAIDRICTVGHLQYNPLGFQANPSTHAPAVALFKAPQDAPAATPTSDTGPFRVTLVNLHYQRDVLFGQGTGPRGNVPFPPIGGLPMAVPPAPVAATGPAINEQFFAQVQLTAEPRLSVAQNGPLRVLEATDDRGQSLLVPDNDGPFTQRVSGYFGMAGGAPTLPFQVPLTRPRQPARTIKRLAGSLSVVVSTRKPDPLVIPLANASGKSFQNGDVALSIQEIRTDPNTRQTHIDLSIRSQGGASASIATNGPQGDFLIPRPDSYQQQIEIVDAQGRPIPWYNTSYDVEGTRLTLTLLSQPDRTNAAEIRFHALARAATDVQFAFEDVPMP